MNYTPQVLGNSPATSDKPHPDLFMPHLKEQNNAAPAKDPSDDLLHRDHYTFNINHTDPRGKQWCGQFTNKILTIGEKEAVGRARTKRQHGMPVEAFSMETYEIIYMLTWLDQSLVQKPEWAVDFSKLYDVEIMQAVFEHVQRHESAFRGGSKKPSEVQA